MFEDYTKLINKWKPILEYSSDNIKKLNEHQYFEVANILERYEKWIESYNFYDYRIDDKTLKDIKFEYSKLVIPSIRINEGTIESIKLNGELYFIVDSIDRDKPIRYAVTNKIERFSMDKNEGIIKNGNVFYPVYYWDNEKQDWCNL